MGQEEHEIKRPLRDNVPVQGETQSTKCGN